MGACGSKDAVVDDGQAKPAAAAVNEVKETKTLEPPPEQQPSAARKATAAEPEPCDGGGKSATPVSTSYEKL